MTPLQRIKVLEKYEGYCQKDDEEQNRLSRQYNQEMVRAIGEAAAELFTVGQMRIALKQEKFRYWGHVNI